MSGVRDDSVSQPSWQQQKQKQHRYSEPITRYSHSYKNIIWWFSVFIILISGAFLILITLRLVLDDIDDLINLSREDTAILQMALIAAFTIGWLCMAKYYSLPNQSNLSNTKKDIINYNNKNKDTRDNRNNNTQISIGGGGGSNTKNSPRQRITTTNNTNKIGSNNKSQIAQVPSLQGISNQSNTSTLTDDSTEPFNKHSNQDYRSAENDINDVKINIDELQKIADERTDEVANIIKFVNDRIDKLRQNGIDIDTITSLKMARSIEDCKRFINDLIKASDSSLLIIKNLESDVKQRDDTIEKLKGEKADIEFRVSTQVREDVTRKVTQQVSQQKDSEMYGIKKKNEEYQRQIEEINESNDLILNEKDKEIEKLTNEKNQLLDRNEDVNEKMGNLQGIIKELKSEKETLINDKKELTNQCDELKSENERMKNNDNNNNVVNDNGNESNEQVVSPVEEPQHAVQEAGQKSSVSNDSGGSKIISGHGVFVLNGLFKDIAATVKNFESIRSKGHAECLALLKEEYYDKNNELTNELESVPGGKTKHKKFLTQTYHNVLFDILQCCYYYVLKSQHEKYEQIRKQMAMQPSSMTTTIIGGDNDDEKSLNNDNMDIGEQIGALIDYFDETKNDNIKTLDFLVHRYVQDNWQNVLNEMLEKIVKNVLNRVDIKHEKFMSFEKSDDLSRQLKEYIKDCCEACWLCVLQRPILNLYPRKFWMSNIIFNADIHERCNGSDEKPNVLYCVWPVIREKEATLQKEKIYVLTKSKPWKEDSWKKKSKKK